MDLDTWDSEFFFPPQVGFKALSGLFSKGVLHSVFTLVSVSGQKAVILKEYRQSYYVRVGMSKIMHRMYLDIWDKE